jgi:hypothetical protein
MIDSRLETGKGTVLQSGKLPLKPFDPAITLNSEL